MRRYRVIPVLLLTSSGLVKSVRFKNHKYIGDPINAVKIFNEKEVDELAIIDIEATRLGRGPNIKKIAEIAGEAFMPVSYGGGITTLEQARIILNNGIEKVILNKSAHTQPGLIADISGAFGAQSVVISIDVKKDWFGKYRVYTDNGSRNSGKDPVSFARDCEWLGAGEILLNSIERDGTYQGYDLDIINMVSRAVSIPVVACGGAGSIQDFKFALNAHASAVAAGSMFVFQRPHNAVLISYPSEKEFKEKLYK